MAFDVRGYWRRLAGKRQLDVYVAIGLLFLIVSQIEFIKSLYGSWYLLLAEFGIALIVAGALGQVIDEQLKKGLVEDAVAEAIGYLLPPELKEELKWTYDQKFLVTQTFNVRLEHDETKKLVRAHAHVIRIFQNISGARNPVYIAGGIDEWFHPEGECRITKCSYTVKDQPTVHLKPKKNACGFSYGDSKQGIMIDANGSVEASFSYVIVMSENSMELLTYRYPIVNALTTVNAPESLVARIVYSHRHKYDVDDEPQSGFIEKPLHGVLMPHQDIRVYWNLADKVAERRKSVSA